MACKTWSDEMGWGKLVHLGADNQGTSPDASEQRVPPSVMYAAGGRAHTVPGTGHMTCQVMYVQ